MKLFESFLSASESSRSPLGGPLLEFTITRCFTENLELCESLYVLCFKSTKQPFMQQKFRIQMHFSLHLIWSQHKRRACSGVHGSAQNVNNRAL